MCSPNISLATNIACARDREKERGRESKLGCPTKMHEEIQRVLNRRSLKNLSHTDNNHSRDTVMSLAFSAFITLRVFFFLFYLNLVCVYFFLFMAFFLQVFSSCLCLNSSSGYAYISFFYICRSFKSLLTKLNFMPFV